MEALAMFLRNRRTLWPLALCFAALLALGNGGCNKQEPGVPANIEGNAASDEASPQVTAAASIGESPFAAARGTVDPSADRDPIVVFKTSHGDITVQLHAQKAPITVDNFLHSYAERDFYTDTIFHYVAPGSMIVGGGYDSQNQLKEPRAEIQSEADNGLSNKKGTIAMARAADFAHSATSQFFFNLADNTQFDHQSRESSQSYGYCVFGTVTQGMDVLEKIAATPTQESEISPALPTTPVVIHAVEISE
jgi:cyclophilin family peptidyl-prolyl cis-trans isomerase